MKHILQKYSRLIYTKYRLIIEGTSALLLLLFLYAALSKLTGYRTFSAALADIPVMSGYAPVLAWLLPVAEIGIAVLLFLPATRPVGLFASFTALIIFTGYLLYMIAFMPNLPCNCGGVLNSLSWKQHVVFNAFFLLINIWALMLYPRVAAAKKRTPP